ncbi:MAG: tetratricopeptide repeat protein [Amphiplicatus sp.]
MALVICVGAVAAFALAPGPAPLAQKEFGDQLFEAGDYARAADALRAAYRAAPSEELRFKLARALYGAGDFAGALETLETSERETVPAQSALRAEALASLGRFDEARRAAEAAGPAYAGRFALISARTYYAQGDYAQAESHLADALRASGEALGEAWLFRARVAFEQGAIDQARAAAKRAAEAGAESRAVEAVEIEALIRANDMKEALLRIESAALPGRKGLFDRRARADMDAQMEYLSGFLSASAGDYASAARVLRPVERHLEYELHGRLVLAAVKHGSGDAAQAEALYLDARRAASDDPITLDALAAFYADRGRTKEALEVVTALEKAAPDLGGLRRLAILSQTGDVDALADAARAMQADAPAPLFASAALFGATSAPARKDEESREKLEALAAAGAARANGDRKRATAAAKRLLPYADNNAAAQVLMGDLLTVTDGDGRARAHYEAATKLAPDAWAPVAGLVRLDVRAGAYRTAQARLEKRLEASGDAPRLDERMALARALRAQDKTGEAAAALTPVEAALGDRPDDALFYAALLSGAGDSERLAAFADRARRALPSAPQTVDILALAGLDEEAAAAARRSALADPGDPARLAAYRTAMARVGRSPEAESFLEALSHARRGKEAPDGEGAKEFVSLEGARRAYDRQPENPAAALQYGTMLRISGESGALAVLREACFWGAEAACAGLGREES